MCAVPKGIVPRLKGMCTIPKGTVQGSVCENSRKPFNRRFVDGAEQVNREDKKKDDRESLTPRSGAVLPAMTNRVGRICNTRDMHSRPGGTVIVSVFVKNDACRSSTWLENVRFSG